MKRRANAIKRSVRKLILRNFQSPPDDIVMLTAAVRDLHFDLALALSLSG